MSVCLPVFNGERCVAQAIETLFAQEFGDYELVIRNIYFAEQALLGSRRWVARFDLRHTVRADRSLAARATA